MTIKNARKGKGLGQKSVETAVEVKEKPQEFWSKWVGEAKFWLRWEDDADDTVIPANKLSIGRFPSKRCVTIFQNNPFLTCQRLNIWLFSYHFALLSVLQKWLLCQPTLFTKNPPNTGNIFEYIIDF